MTLPTELRPHVPQKNSFTRKRRAVKRLCARCRRPGRSVRNARAKEWWRGEDLNLRRRCQQIYSLPPLATRVPLHSRAPETGRPSPAALRDLERTAPSTRKQLELPRWRKACQHFVGQPCPISRRFGRMTGKEKGRVARLPVHPETGGNGADERNRTSNHLITNQTLFR